MEKISLLLLFVCVCIPALPIDSNYEECDNTFASYQASFDYTEQGANWTDPLCKSGKKQSPIKITSGRVQNSDDISMSLECKDISSGTISLDGSDLSIKFNGCNAAFKADNATTKWTSQEIRFHSPSEHIIDDTNEELEIQILFTNDASHDKNLFFSMMFELLEGSSNNTFIESLELNDIQAKKTKSLANVPLHDKIVTFASKEMFVYEGSLTTPPCTEGVWWVIADHYEKMSTRQSNLFNQLWKGNKDFAKGNGNNRLIQSSASMSIYRINLDSSKKPLPIWAVILLIIGGVIIVVAIIFVFGYFCRRPQIKQAKEESSSNYKKHINDAESSSFSFL